MKTIIFVCHGNICRSVAAEFICKKLLKDFYHLEEFNVFSRATSLEEIGNDIYPPMKIVLKEKHIPFDKHFANQITQKDYDLTDYIFYMDEYNKRNLNRMLDDYKNIIKPITYLEKDISYIEDPWYTDNFVKVVDQLTQCIKHILEEII